jgi:hypothetical protein
VCQMSATGAAADDADGDVAMTSAASPTPTPAVETAESIALNVKKAREGEGVERGSSMCLC